MPDFVHKNAIALKEAREANYWLRLILATEDLSSDVRMRIEEIRDEALVIAKIAAKSIITTKNRKPEVRL